MAFVVGVVIFVLALLVSVTLHEAGHFATARAFGMKVTAFFVGIGPTIWSRRRGETEYGLKAVPFGGFVRIFGVTDLDEVDPSDEPRAFRAKPGWQRVAFYAAGSLVHFTIAFVLLWLVAFGIGVDSGFNASATPATITVLPCVPVRTAPGCTAGDPRSPAVRAGLHAGDTITAIAGAPVRNWTQLRAAISAQPAGMPEPFTVLRHGRQLTLQVTLAALRHKGSYLGIEPATPVQGVSHPGLIGAISYAGSEFGRMTAGSVHALGEIPRAIPYLFTPNRARTPGGQVSSVVGAASLTGQVANAGIGWWQKIADLTVIVVSLNIFVGLFNLLPLLPMDGGKIVVVLYERARAVLARLRHRPDPGLTDVRWLIPVSLGMFALLVAFSLLLVTADIVNPVRLVG